MEPIVNAAAPEAIRWDVARPCFSRDIGSQRCRVPMHLMSVLKISAVGTPVLIDCGSHSSLCSAYVWHGQSGNHCQVDDTVTVPHTDTRTASTLSPAAFQVLQMETLKRVNVSIILKDVRAVEDFRTNQERWLPLVRDVLSTFTVMLNCVISCEHFAPCHILGIHSMIVQKCPLKPLMAGKVTSKTIVEVDQVMSRLRYEALAPSTPATFFGGLEKPRQLLRELVMFPFANPEVIASLGFSFPKGILLVGPPGTGKTSLVRIVARDCGACVVYVAGPSICRPHPGESEAALREVFERAVEQSREGPCILFVDEVDSILAKGEKASGQSNRLLSQMLMLMDGLESRGKLVVVGATNRPNVLDPAVRRHGRFGREVYIGVATKTERVAILKALTEKFPLKDVNLENIADLTPGYVGADLALLCQEVRLSKFYSSDKSDEQAVTEGDFRRVLMVMRPSTQRSSFSSNYEPVAWNDIGGLQTVKDKLKQSLEWPILYADAFHRLGVSMPNGVLLYGPPGCCKTKLVRAAATACNASFFSASAAQLYSPHVGDSEKAISEIFHRSRLAAPTILFLDEIDAIVGKRGDGSSNGVHEKVLSTLLNEMDGIGIRFTSRQGSSTCGEQLRERGDTEQEDFTSNPGPKGDVFVVAATNRPDMLDEALIRPGRFDRIIYVPPPDIETRKQILQVVTRKMPVSDIDLKDLATRTNHFSGADLENLCNEAALYALTKEGFQAACIHQEHFLFVLETMKPSLTKEQLDFFSELQQRYNNFIC